MIKTIRIPKERTAVLIGKHGAAKREIENLGGVKIKVNEEIEIEGEPINVMNVENVIKAVGRGFSFEKSLQLLDEDYTLYIISLPKNERTLKRTRSRLIGTKGKVRKNIEIMTKTFVSVYGRTVSIIGRYDDTEKAREAVEKLIAGYSHKGVYKSLSRTR